MATLMHPMNMDLRSLKHVVVLSRTLSYTRAAEQLGLTQSALSRSIQSFEQRLAVKLFDRDRSGVHLTALGRTFAERAAAVLQDTDDLARMVKLSGSAEAGEVIYGMAPMPAKALLVSSFTEVLTNNPGLRSSVVVRRAEVLLSMLIAEEIEFFICAERQVPESAPTRAEPLGWFTMSLLVRPGHPMLAAGSDAERAYPLLLAERPRTDAVTSAVAIPSLSGPHHLIEDYSAAARITEQTDAIWVSSPLAAAEEIREGRLVALPGNHRRPPRVRLVMYSLNRRSLSPAALMLKKLYQKQIKTLTPAED